MRPRLFTSLEMPPIANEVRDGLELPVFLVEFEKGFDRGSKTVTPEGAATYVEQHPWACVILMPDEAAYNNRHATVFDGT